MTHLLITTRATPTGHVLSLVGELDLTTADRLRAACADLALTAGQTVVLDLTGLAFCDSSGVAAFITVRNRAAALDVVFVLAAPPPTVSRMFTLLGLSQIFTIHDSTPAAPTGAE